MKIFVTVGAQMPFDRLVSTVDVWAAKQKNVEVFAQTGSGDYVVQNIDSTKFIQPEEFKERVEWADRLVAHAGMGSIITALQHGKPILTMPRRASLQETRNDHQLATAERFLALDKIAVAMNETELLEKLSSLDELDATQKISAYASEQLIGALSAFIQQDL